MDREIPIEVRRKALQKQIIRAAIIVVAAIAVICIIINISGSSIPRKSLILCTVDRGTIETSYTASGVVAPAFEEIINSPITSRVLEVYHKSGDAVEEGTPLLKLDLQEAKTDLGKAEDELNMKKCELEQLRLNNQTELNDLAMKVKVAKMEENRMEVEVRNERYLDSLGSGTTDKVREAEMNLKKGELQLAQMQQQYSNEKLVKAANYKSKELEYSISQKNLENIRKTFADAQIKAPRKAVLTFINNQIGAQVAQGSKVASVADLNHYKVDCEIADTYGSRVAVGGKAIVRIGSKQMTGMITNVTPQSQNGMNEFSVQLEKDDDPALRSGLKVEVFVMSSIKDNVLRIANGSFYSADKGEYDLFVLEGNDKLVKRKIKLGDSNFDYIEVLSGLSEGEKVVVNDMTDYKNKGKLKIK